MSESDPAEWDEEFQKWLKEHDLPADIDAFTVFKTLMQKNASTKKSLVVDLEARFASIDKILNEVPGHLG